MSQIALAAPVLGISRTSASRRTPLQLTRRGRLVLLVLPALVAVALLAVLVGGMVQPAQASDHATGPGLEQVTVMEGESLWSLARTYAPSQDTRDVVAEIQDLNALTGPLQAGQTITVPTDV